MRGVCSGPIFVVLAARPSLGKSTLAFNIARHAAGQGAVVGVFSLEMSAAQIVLRLLSSEAGIDGYRLRLGLLSDSEETRQQDAIGALSDLPIYMDDTPIQGIVEMRGKARRLQTERGLDMLVVDYLQLISGTGRGDNRVQEMGEISRSLKGLARDLDIPILACSQLSRAVEQRPIHRPLLSDLRESGSIEQDSDVVAFIYREDILRPGRCGRSGIRASSTLRTSPSLSCPSTATGNSARYLYTSGRMSSGSKVWCRRRGRRSSRRMAFGGLPRRVQYTPVPNPMFGTLLEQIDDVGELKCTLRLIWMLHRKRGYPKLVTLRELKSDRTLARSLAHLNDGRAIERAMGLAVKRGTFLEGTDGRSGDTVYVLNSEQGRAAMASGVKRPRSEW